MLGAGSWVRDIQNPTPSTQHLLPSLTAARYCSISGVSLPAAIMSSDTWHVLARMLIGDPELTGIEVAEQAGMDFEETRRLWRALGFPPVPDDQRVFARSDVAVLRQIHALNEEQGTDPEVFLQLTRVTGQSLARVAEAQVASSTALSALLGSDMAEQDKIALVAARIGGLIPHLEPLLGYVWRRHMLAALLRLAASGQESAGGRMLVVGFADLVGFTAISQQLDERELAAMVDRFEQHAYEHIPHHGGRVVKMIGDEVMFSVDSVTAAADIALALVEAHANDSKLPEVRAGLALGKTLSWEGDLFGPTVNLASRLVNIARPSTVLISDEIATELTDERRFTLRSLRPLALKGIGRTRVTVLRRAELDAGMKESRRGRKERNRGTER